MKVLFAVTKSEQGGAQTHVWQLASCLQREGHVAHITAYPGGWLEEQARRHDVPFHSNHFFSNSFNPIRALRAVASIARLVRQISPDVVHCHSSAAGLWARLGVRGAVPTVFTAHGWGFGEGVPPVRRTALRIAERAVARFTDKIICVSHYDRRLSVQSGIASPDRVVVVHNGVEPGFSPRRKRGDGARLRAVFLGRLARPKEPELVLDALAELPAPLQRGYELIFVGDGPLLPALRAKAASCPGAVRFTGALPRGDALNVLAESDLLILVSRHEGFPMSILEGMSMGLAVIASDVGGIEEAVTSDCGILIARGDKEALKRALVYLAGDRGAVDRLGAAAQERARNEFPVSSMFRETMAVYESVQAR